MASFTTSSVSASFTADGNDFQESREARVGIQEIPGGDVFFADRAGRSPLKWSLSVVLLNDTVWGQLNAALGSEGTLAVESLDTHTAVLMKVSRPVPSMTGEVRATVEFLITDT